MYLVRGRPKHAAGGKVHLRCSGRFGGRLSRQTGWNILKQAAEDAELTEEISPHAPLICHAPIAKAEQR